MERNARRAYDRAAAASLAFVEGLDELENLNEMVAELPPQEKRVLCMYFGIGYGEAFNLQEIGKVVGLSKERVRQIKERALARLRDRARDLQMAA